MIRSNHFIHIKIVNTYLVLCALAIFFSINAEAQHFTKLRHSLILPAQVLIEQYQLIDLPGEKNDAFSMSQFDEANPYTYIQVITDKSGKNYHILYQTDFFGKVNLLAYSQTLIFIFNKKEKPFFTFQACIKNLTRSVFATQQSETAIGCIIDRLNYCSE